MRSFPRDWVFSPVYYFNKAKVSWETMTSGSSGHKNENKSSDNSKSDKGKSSSQSKQKNSNQSSGSSQSKGSSSEQKKTNHDLSSKLGKDSKLTQQERQHCLDKNLCLFCRAPAHLRRTAWNVILLKLAPLSSHKTWPWHPEPQAQTWKNTEQSSRLCTTQGLHQTPSCENSHPRCIHSFQPCCPNILFNIWLTTKLSPSTPRRLGIIWSFHWLCICSDSTPTDHPNPTDLTLPYRWNLKFCHHPGSWFAYSLSYQGNSDTVILCRSVGPRLHDCARISLAHLLQSTDWLGIGLHTFPPIVTAWIQDVTLYWDWTVVGTPRFSPYANATTSASNPSESLSYTNQCCHVLARMQTQRFTMFQLRILLPEVMGHSAMTNSVDLANLLKEYHDLADMFSKTKAGKLAEHRPYNLKITLDKGTAPPFGPIYSLSQEELVALCQFIDESLATGFICPSWSLCGAWSSLLGKGWLASTLCQFPRPQPNFQDGSLPTPTHLWPPRCTEKGMGLHQNRPLACISFSVHYSWRQMEDSLPDPLWLLGMAGNARRAY